MLRVDGEVGNLPRVVRVPDLGHALLDGVLVGARESGVDELTGVGVPRVDVHPGGELRRSDDALDVGEVEVGVHPLGEEVHAQRDHVDVPRPLAVPEERPLDSVRSSEEAELSGSDCGPTVVVGVERQQDSVTVLDGATEPLDDVGVEVRGVHLNRGRQVQDERALRSWLEHVHDRFADRYCKLRLGSSKALRRVLVANVGVRNGRFELLAPLRRLNRQRHNAWLVLAEHHTALERRGGVVEVHDGSLGSAERLKRALHEFPATLHENLDRDVVGDPTFFDQHALEVEVGLRG